MMKLYVLHDYKSRFPQLSGHELTDALIRACLGEVVVRRSEKGKPSLAPADAAGSADCYISVSHSENTFALLTADRNVGMDIQYAREVRADRIAARVFTEEETAYAAEDGTGIRFFRIWTQKEAFSKYTGLGMEQIMRKDSVLGRDDVAFTELRLEDGCFCAICTEKEGDCKADEIQISYGK